MTNDHLATFEVNYAHPPETVSSNDVEIACNQTAGVISPDNDNSKLPENESAMGGFCRTACVIDLDNLCNHKAIRGTYPTLRLDFFKLTAALRQRGIQLGSVCQNRDFSPFCKKVWGELGLKMVAVHKNCDDAVMLEAVNYALEQPERIILVAGDGDYIPVVEAIKACGIKIELWSIRYKTARELIYLADQVVWIDDLFNEPPPSLAESINIRRSQAASTNLGPGPSCLAA